MKVESGGGGRFDYHRMDVYRAAIKFAGWQRRLLQRLRSGDAELADKLGRAATSIVLNIAEGCGEFSAPERARFYRMARRSAAECAAALDLLEEFDLFPSAALEDGRVLLDRIMAMLTVLIARSRSAKQKSVR